MAKLSILQPQFAPAVFRLKLDVCCFISSHFLEQRESFSLLIFATYVLSRVNSQLPNRPVARTACRAKNYVGPTQAFVQSEATSRFLFLFFSFILSFLFLRYCASVGFPQTSKSSSGATTPLADGLMCLISGSTAGNFSVLRYRVSSSESH